MAPTPNLDELSTDELIAQFKAAIIQGQPPRELVVALSQRPGVAFIGATDSTQTTLEKAKAAIAKVEQANHQP